MRRQKLKEELLLAHRILNYPYPIRKKVMEEYQKGYILSSSEIGSLCCKWEVENSILQQRCIRNPYDLLHYQDDLNQILETHQGYLKLPLQERKEMVESMFLHRFYRYLKPHNRFSLIREAIHLNLSQCRLKKIPVFMTDSLLPGYAMSHLSFLQNEKQMIGIAVNRETERVITNMGVRKLEEIYHELDHHYVSELQLSKEFKECFFSMGAANLIELCKYNGFYHDFVYHFLPSEYHAFQNSYEIVKEILKQNPYAVEADIKSLSIFQYPQLQKILNRFNQYFSTHYTLEEARNLVLHYLLSCLEQEGRDEFLEILHLLGLDENDYHPKDRELASQYIKQLK